MKQVVIINDILNGCMGERVFWNFMLEGIPGIKGVELNYTPNAKQFIDANFPKDAIIIQNATFIPKVDDTRYTIAFLQDNLRSMNRQDQQQEYTLRSSQQVVFNSYETSKSYPEFNGTIIPIGIDTKLFAPIDDKHGLRTKYNIPHDKQVGIFVGDFSPVKGWSDVADIIERRPDVHFILVSKAQETYERHNTTCFSRVPQDQLAELLNCADFFIVGSPVETQCLAALEAGFCGLPIVMKQTGIFMDWDTKTRDKLGVFDNNLMKALDTIGDINKYTAREILQQQGLGIDHMINQWVKLLEVL